MRSTARRVLAALTLGALGVAAAAATSPDPAVALAAADDVEVGGLVIGGMTGGTVKIGGKTIEPDADGNIIFGDGNIIFGDVDVD